MGMDVWGKKPESDVGEYFRANVWGWHPLASCMLAMAPDPMSKVECLHTNDGDGLNARDAVRLADTLDAAIAAGKVQKWIAAYEAAKAALPLEECKVCGGTGVRTDPIGVKLGMDIKGTCNACNPEGTSATPGQREAFETSYGTSLERVQEFSAFARASGGFEIC